MCPKRVCARNCDSRSPVATSDKLVFFAAPLLMINFTTTYTTSTTNGYRHDTTQSVVIQRGAQNRRARRVRRGDKKEQRSCEKILSITFHSSSLAADKDEPKASQSPFKSVQSVSSVFQSCRSTPKALKREAPKKSSW